MHSKKSTDVGLWVFGYGSLIWRPDMPHIRNCQATLRGWSRRFWQGSHDHRGTIESPGRVLTLVPIDGEVCVGRVFGITHADVDQTLMKLDYREKNGYERQQISVDTLEYGELNALTYIASAGNPAWLGDASDKTIAQQIMRSKGPSGLNTDYVLSLNESLLAEGIHDAHIQHIVELVNA